MVGGPETDTVPRVKVQPKAEQANTTEKKLVRVSESPVGISIQS